MQLTSKQHRFGTDYLVDLNATQAALRAGCSARMAPQQGSRLSKNVDVQAAIATRQTEQLAAVEVRIEDVLRDLKAISRTDLQALASLKREVAADERCRASFGPRAADLTSQPPSPLNRPPHVHS